MKEPLLLIVLVLSSFLIKAQTPSLDVASIPDAIKKNANVVKRYENTFFEITDIDRAYLKVHKIFTVMNENGADELLFVRGSLGKFITLEDVDIKVYDARGKQVAKYKRKTWLRLL